MAGHALETREHIGADVAEWMPDVQAGARRVGEHVEDEQLLTPVGEQRRISQRAGGVGGLEGSIRFPPVLP